MSSRWLALVLCAGVGAGCAESAMIRSAPPSAQVWVNEKYVGITPVRWLLPRSEWPDNRRFYYRAVREGYPPKEGEFHSVVTAGRIIGGVSTLGILFIFKHPTTLADTYDIELEPVARTTVRGARSPVEERLRQLDDLYEHGAINDQERLRRRHEILEEL